MREAPEPTAGPGEVVVRVRAAALNPKDIFLRAGKPAWIRWLGGALPRGVGFDLAGEREDTGERVFAMLDGFRGATVAERVAVPVANLAPMPSALGFVEAAGLPLVSLTALQGLRDDGRLAPGARVLVHGASGGVGTAAVQLARALGAARVVTTSSAANHGLCRSLGADRTLDYATDPLPPPDETFDVVFDAIGNQPFGRWRGALADGGTLVGTVPLPSFLFDVARTPWARRRARLVAVRGSGADLRRVAEWVAAGSVRPVVDAVYPLDQVAEAFARLESRRARGKVVIEIG